MDFANTVLGRIFRDGHRDYTLRKGNVTYLDGRALARPSSLPGIQRIFALVVVIAAIVIGYIFMNETVFAQARQAALSQQSVTENLARVGSIESTPNMASLIHLSDDEIKASFEESGFNTVDITSNTETGNFTVYRLPEDVSVEDGALLVSKGIDNLNVSQATLLLNGAWYFQSDRIDTLSMVVRYADFTSGDEQIAIQKALEHQGFDPASVTDFGRDEAGNYFETGTVTVDDVECSWRISALPLEDMYSISGLPENAIYVGVRVTEW